MRILQIHIFAKSRLPLIQRITISDCRPRRFTRLVGQRRTVPFFRSSLRLAQYSRKNMVFALITVTRERPLTHAKRQERYHRKI